MSEQIPWEKAPFKSGIKVTIEVNDFETLALLVRFLADSGFKVKSKDDQTLVRGGRSADRESSK